MNDKVIKINNEEFTVINIVKHNDKNYIIYKDINNEIYASNYEIIDNKLVFNDIEDENIYEHLESLLGENNE